ncbi:S8 family serine peptidase [Hymenobacter sp. DG25A]|uniref:S8 family serine peptidase n=1 Tax=Hymenobacter sp. DG25A TaxID=1385663 RepID=UPI0018D12DA6|nr:S8 family serine peptidase [Hymenobacter sp. DG25A]
MRKRMAPRWAVVLLSMCLLPWPSAAQSINPSSAPYWVFLRDKRAMQLNPQQYFTAPAQLRRQRQHLPAADSTDFPVRPDYVQALRSTVDSVTSVSRWFNAVACWATPAQIAQVRRLPGVREVVARYNATPDLLPARRKAAVAAEPLSEEDLQLARRQTSALGSPALHQAQLNGHGMRIAIFDVGFRGVDAHPAFQKLLKGHQITDTWDFIRQKPQVYAYGDHGTEVLSCLAGQFNDSTSLGLAPAAEYLLARTEREHSERYSEEEAWLAAVEWADKHGADIINSSLGYTDRRYFREQMDGRTSLVARAAALAVRKGMLVVCSAGNDGDNQSWGVIGTPADNDSVLAVGGLDPATWLPVDFTSRGPTAKRRLKPNVAAFGIAITARPAGGFERNEGTSFSSPLVAGFAACIWQRQRGLTAMQLFQQIEKSATLYPYFDYAQGYGSPQAAYFLRPHEQATRPTFDFVRQENGLLQLILRPEASAQPAQTLPLQLDEPNRPLAALPPLPLNAKTSLPLAAPAYVYLHVADARGVLRRYEVREVTQRYVASWALSTLQPGDQVRASYKGYTQAYTVSQ